MSEALLQRETRYHEMAGGLAIEPLTDEEMNFGPRFYGAITSQTLLYGERGSYDVVAMGIATGKPIIFGGPPGVGKTQVGANYYRFVGEYRDNDGEQQFVTIPKSKYPDIACEPELQPIDMFGGSISKNKVTTRQVGSGATETVSETSVTDIEGLFDPKDYGMFLDEIDNAPPRTLKTLNSVLEEKLIRRKDGTFNTPNLHLVVATKNAKAARSGSFDMDSSLISRFAFGDILGYDVEDQHKLLLMNGIIPDPEKIRPVVPFDYMKFMLRAIQKIRIASNPGLRYVAAADAAERALFDALNGEVVEKGRLHIQAGLGARCLAYFDQTATVSPDHFGTALRYSLATGIAGKCPRSEDAYEMLSEVHRAGLNVL